MAPKPDRKITRTREFRSCTECRKRKLRCDRNGPCGACKRRGEESGCLYESNLKVMRNTNAEEQLEKLEHLIQVLQNQQPSKPLSNGREAQAVRDLPFAEIYCGPTHWSAMLDELDGLRAAIETHDNMDLTHEGHGNNDSMTMQFSAHDDGADVLFGALPGLSYKQIISSALPVKTDADRLVASYFRAKALAAPFIHSGQFRQQYCLFWDSPANASPLWAAILFSILDIACSTQTAGLSDSADRRFARAAAQCLVAGSYHRPQPHCVEALLLYLQARCITSSELSPQIAVLFGTLVRTATIMGYHREEFGLRSGLSTFDREMRRRSWSLCMQLDVLISFQLGLPSNVQYPTWNTLLPSNLLDSDLNEAIEKMPPPRKDEELTELSFYIAKHRLIAVFEKVLRASLTTADGAVSDAETLDGELRQVYTSLPHIFHARPMSDSVVDAPSVIVTRLCVFFIYQKSLCVLHRRGAALGDVNSLEKCFSAASSLVKTLLDVYKEFEVGGFLEAERWFLGSITWHDFLIGCSALCLVFHATQTHTAAAINNRILDTADTLNLITKAKAICEANATRGRSTRKVAQLLGLVATNHVNGHQCIKDEEGQMSSATNSLNITPNYDDISMWSKDATDPGWDFMAQYLNFATEGAWIRST